MAGLCGCGPAPLTDEEKATIASLSLDSLKPLPSDPTNAYADDPAAAAFGATLFMDTRLSRDGTVSCGTCHKIEQAAFTKGKHGKLRQDGNMAAPGCTDCHSAHGIQQHESANFQVAVIEDCGTCHQDYLSTYRDTFHGQVTELGYARMATCASCHGAHDILPASDPASTVSAQNRLATCQKCHAGASANFASFDPHANRHDKARNPIYYYAALFMELLLFGVFSFFGIHTVFWLYREIRVKLGGKRGGDPS